MSRLALKQYIHDLAVDNESNILVNTKWSKLGTFLQVPKRSELGSGIAIVVGPSHRVKTRAAAPRGFGHSMYTYTQTVLMHATSADSQEGGADFDAAVEAACFVYATCPSPAIITDPRTGTQYNLLSIGEEITDEVEEPAEIGGKESLIHFFATLQFTCTVDVQI